MGVPKHKQSQARGARRRTHWKLAEPQTSICPQCNQTKLPHRVCKVCGYYGTKKIIAKDEE